MALSATVFKIDLQIADLDRHYYRDHALTVARHPSETDERMMLRVLAFARHASDRLIFGKGLSTEDEPDLWAKTLSNDVETWIDIGLPEEKRVRRACGRSQQVVIYAYGGNAVDNWWRQQQKQLRPLDKLAVYQVPPAASEALASMAQRSMRLQCTIQEGELLFTDGQQTVQFTLETLKPPRPSERAA